MASLFRKTLTRYVDADGNRTTKAAPGARKKRERSKHWYGRYRDAEGIERTERLAANKTPAQQMLNALVKDAELARCGIVNPFAEPAALPIAKHFTDFVSKMRAAGRTSDHADSTHAKLQRIATFCGFATIGDINADSVSRFARHLKDEEQLSARTVQSYLTAAKSFTKWLVETDKLGRDPLVTVRKPNPKTDRRLERRTLLHDEWSWLRTVTLSEGVERFGVTAGERVTLYATAIQTGLRSSELRSLTRGRLFLDRAQPFITCRAGSTKNRKEARQYIQPDLAAELQELIATKAPKAPVFRMPHTTDVARMLREDVEAARTAWLTAAIRNPEEYARRDQSDFLTAVSHEGEKLDFHSLRHTCGAWLAMTGAHPNDVKAVMRHSTITLTMDTYGHLFPGQEANTIARLPSMMSGSEPSELRATGTDDADCAPSVVARMVARPTDIPCDSVSAIETKGGGCEPSPDSPEAESLQPIETDCRPLTASRAGQTRTGNQRIMSPLL